MNAYTYVKDSGTAASWGIVVLPEIFGLNGFIKSTVDRLSEIHHVPVVALDHMYLGAGESKVYDYVADLELALKAMENVKGEDFVKLFSSTLDEVQVTHPSIKSFAVVGYCFGGKLAYLAGVDPRVACIVSYYGARPHTDSFYSTMTVIQALASARRGDTALRVSSFYGGIDGSITEEDRARSKSELALAGIQYEETVYAEAGHAFCNSERVDRYDAKASNASIARVDDVLSKYARAV